jgi:cytoskeletal protein CcmA (bactofilin family)
VSADGPPVNGWLGPGVSFTGSLTWSGRVRVDGTLDGDVTTPDLLDLGPTGRVEGTVTVAQALVAGTLVGRLVASERVTVLESGRVEGVIETPWLDVRPGAQLNAQVKVNRG